MDDNTPVEPIEQLSFWDGHRYLLLIAIVIAIALVLVGISMTLYVTSGAAQLDLSRPGYRSVSSQAINNDSEFKNYSSTGPINNDSIAEFKALYEKQAASAKAVDAFSGDPLSPDTLEISAQATQ